MSGPAKAFLAVVMVLGVALVGGGVYMLATDDATGPIEPGPDDPAGRPTIGGGGAPRTGPDGSGGPIVENTQTPPFRVDPTPADVNVVPPPSQDAGYIMRAIVRDEDGKAFDGATVTVTGGDATRARMPAMRGLGNGIYEITGLIEGEYTVKLRAAVDKANTSFTKAQTDVRIDKYGEIKVAAFTVPRPGINTVEGYVTTPGGVGGGIELVFDSPAFEAHAFTKKDDGAYRVERLPPGTYTFRAIYRGPGGEQADLADLVLDIPSSMTYSPRLDVGSLDLTVAAEGAPGSGRRIEFLRIEQQESALAAVATSVASGTTDANGNLKIAYVPAGNYTLVIAGLVAEPDQITLNYGATVRTISARKPRSPYED